MHHLHPLLIDRANVRMPGLSILAFALHRHLPADPAVEPHRHRWSQALLYLSGQGSQALEQGTLPVEPGTVVILPPGVVHSFRRAGARAPLSLAIDFRLDGEQFRNEAVCRITRSELLEIRREMAGLLRLQTRARGVLPWESTTVVLHLLISLLRAAGWVERARLPGVAEISPAIQQLVSSMDPTLPLLNVVQRSGYHRDHLNRLVKKETGLTLGQIRNQQRLAKAKELLAEGMQVGSAAASVGLPDQSYFARWFRQQTGRPPSQWLRLTS